MRPDHAGLLKANTREKYPGDFSAILVSLDGMQNAQLCSLLSAETVL